MFEFVSKAMWSWILFVGRLLITVLISLLVIGLFIIFWFLPGSALYVSKNFSISPRLSFYWHTVAYSSPFNPLYICDISFKVSSFISNFIDLSPLLFLMSLAKGLTILFFFSKNQLLVLLIFAIFFFHFYFIYFSSDFYDFFPSTILGFYFFFFL